MQKCMMFRFLPLNNTTTNIPCQSEKYQGIIPRSSAASTNQITSTKCDKKRPACGQCIRATLSCPGYINPDNILLRDQTHLTIHRIFNAQTSHIQSPSAVSPNISLVDRAKCFFVSNQVFGPQPTFHYMKNFFPPRESDAFLINSVRAVALAYLANDTGRLDIMLTARLKYSKALLETREALGRKVGATRNEALIAVLLMDMFERLSRDEPAQSQLHEAAPEASTTQVIHIQADTDTEFKHLAGAMAICKLRGPSQFEDSTSIPLFHHLSCNILHYCIERGVVIPEDYLQLRAEAAPLILADDERWRAENLLIDFLDFRNLARTDNTCNEDADRTMNGLKEEYLELCRVFPRTPVEANTHQDPAHGNPMQKRNNLCYLRGLMDDIFEECDAMLRKRRTNENLEVSVSLVL